MRLQYHAVFSLTISGILFLIFKSWGMALGCLISGIFIDLDHIYDYVREHGQTMGIRNFFHINHNAQYDRIVLFWHGWEWVVLLGAAAWLTGWNPWVTGIFIGVGHHILLDTVAHNADMRSYSLLWRWKRNFLFDSVFSNMKGLKYKYKNSSNLTGK